MCGFPTGLGDNVTVVIKDHHEYVLIFERCVKSK
jgi:hypothetical protein